MAQAYVEIPLTKGMVALVDVEDAERVIAAGKWRFAGGDGHAGSYALTGGSGGRPGLYMHRLVAGTKKNEHVDHINGDRLDNRRENLRVATPKQNAANRGPALNNKSGFKGVVWHKWSGKWNAQHRRNGKRGHIGYYETEAEAAEAYDRYVRAKGPSEFERFNRPNIGERGLDGEIRTI